MKVYVHAWIQREDRGSGPPWKITSSTEEKVVLFSIRVKLLFHE